MPVYNPVTVSKLSDDIIKFIIPDSQFLEVLLLQIRGETIKYSCALKKKSCEKESTLIKEIESLENKNDEVNYVQLEEKKKELEILRTEKLKGHMIRSRAEWLCESEKPSKYFCALEKHLYSEKTIRKLVTGDRNIINDQVKILEEVKKFYQNLFRKKECRESELHLKNLESLSGLNKLSQIEAESLEGLLTIDEISHSLKLMKNNKSPGIDGFPRFLGQN